MTEQVTLYRVEDESWGDLHSPKLRVYDAKITPKRVAVCGSHYESEVQARRFGFYRTKDWAVAHWRKHARARVSAAETRLMAVKAQLDMEIQGYIT